MFELGTDGPRSILVGVDGSETSMRAGAYAGGLARRQNAHLYVVFVRVIGGGMSAEAIVANREAQAAMLNELRENAAHQAQRLGLSLSILEREGNPYTEIVRAANELRVDAVVVGASTRAGHRLVGSLAGRLVRDARWPVTVVP